MTAPEPECAAEIPAVTPLTRFAWLSIAAAVVTIVLKTEAYLLTGSVGLLSDAAESLVNLVAAVIALVALAFAARPADAGHPFGHGKAEYFASGFEGTLILIAAGGIAWAAWERLRHPVPLARLDIGMVLSASAGAVNLVVAMILLRAGRRHGSIVLEADARHLLSDVWTTVAVLAALGGIALTGWPWLDPVIAFVAAAQIVWSGFKLVARSVSGLLDAAMPVRELGRIEEIFGRYRSEGIQFHDLRTRVSGTQRFMTVHVLVPGCMSVHDGHDLVERIERDLRAGLKNLTVTTHLEPVEDKVSFAHEKLETGDAGVPPDLLGPVSSCRSGRSGKTGIGIICYGLGVILLLCGSAGSLLLPDRLADAAMAMSLFGLVMVLFGNRASKTPDPRKEKP